MSEVLTISTISLLIGLSIIFISFINYNRYKDIFIYIGASITSISIVVGFLLLGMLHSVEHKLYKTDKVYVLKTPTNLHLEIYYNKDNKVYKYDTNEIGIYNNVNDSTTILVEEYINSYGGIINKYIVILNKH